MKLNLLMCVTQIISTPTECTQYNYVSLKQLSTLQSKPSEVELKSTDLNNKCQIIKIKDSIKDNIIHFVNNKSNPYDKDALSLVENNKIESKQSLNIAVN